MKPIVKAFLKGIATFDRDGDGIVTWREIKEASLDTWITFLTGLTTAILSTLQIAGL